MQRCLDLARKALGNTYPNPVVGCVIVHEDRIIGEGFHSRAGTAHAEIHAIRSVKNAALLPESTIYVSLEPCAHYGKTPPCAEALAASGFRRVVIGCLDANDDVNGKGKTILEAAGIEVIVGVLEKECREINRRFFTFHEKKRPYLILKWAQSGDGFVDRNFAPSAISNTLTKQWVHTLRSREHAIFVGTKTALTDNPSLTTREIEGRNPIRILLDLQLKVPATFNLFNDEAETIVLNSLVDRQENNITYVKVNSEDLWADIMRQLHQRQIQSVIVEGGPATLQQLIDLALWDETMIIKNEYLILAEGTKAPEFLDEPDWTETLRDNTIEFYRNGN